MTLSGSNWHRPYKLPKWPARSLYGRLGGTAGLDGRSKRQFHIWRALSPRWGRAASLLIPLPWNWMDGASPLRLLATPHTHTHPCCLGLSILIWLRVGMGASPEGCEWWRLGIKGAPAAARTVAGSAAALVGSFSPSRRQTPKVRPCKDLPLLKPHIQVGTSEYRP